MKTKTETGLGGQAQGSLLLACPQLGFPTAGLCSRIPEAHSHTIGKFLVVWCSAVLTLVQERCPFVVARNVAGQCPEYLPSRVK
jgi:hypothetical protein